MSKNSKTPDTVVGDEGSAKRNILRKNNKVAGGSGRARKETAGSRIDDGSMYGDGAVYDDRDPNYDSEEETLEEKIKYLPPATLRRAVGNASMTLTKYKKTIEPIIKEYFVSGDIDEILTSIYDINVPEYSYEFVKRSINMSFDQGDRERELVSQLISNGYPDTFSANMIGKGFERLFELIDEIEKDAPNAREMLATYISRAVVDDVLPPSFLSDAVVKNLGGEIIEHSKRMLSRDHSGAKLEKVWGPGDGRPVEEMKVAVDQLLQEYLVSCDLEEASRCIKQLQSPNFYHEIVKRAITHAMDKTVEQRHSMSTLLTYLVERDQLTRYQAMKGFNRLHFLLPDLQLDTPAAATILAEFVAKAKEDSVLPVEYVPLPHDHRGHRGVSGGISFLA